MKMKKAVSFTGLAKNKIPKILKIQSGHRHLSCDREGMISQTDKDKMGEDDAVTLRLPPFFSKVQILKLATVASRRTAFLSTNTACCLLILGDKRTLYE